MATKPAETPDWNTGGANRTEPNGAKKTLGWVTNESPPSSTFNWLFNIVYQWCAYLKDAILVGEAGQPGLQATGGTGNTYGVRGVGSGNGAGVRGEGGGTNADGGSFQGASGGHGLSATGGSGAGGISAQGGAGAHGVNATGGAGAPGVLGTAGAGAAAGVVGAGAGGNEDGVHGSGSGSGVGVAAFKGSGTDAFKADGDLDLSSASNPASTAARKNRVTPMNVPKAWVLFTANGTVNPTIIAGFNVASVTQEIAGGFDGRFTVTFPGGSGMASGAYAVVPVPENITQYQSEVSNKGTGSFQLRPQNPATLAYINSASQSGAVATFFVQVFGAQ